MTADKLKILISQRFPDRPVTFGSPPEPIAVFVSPHPEVGEIRILDDEPEVIVEFSRFTHSHFGEYELTSLEQVEQKVAERVVDFLADVFDDKIVLWGTATGGSGGWYSREHGSSSGVARGRRFVWSGPLEETG